MGRAIDLFVTYRFIKILVTPFEKQEAYKFGIIDDKGKVLKKYKTLLSNGKLNQTYPHSCCQSFLLCCYCY